MLRFGVLALAVTLSIASTKQNQQARQPGTPPSIGGGSGAPQPEPMDPSMALGLWKSSFGAVKVERDESSPNHLMGVWVYERGGNEVIGFFRGAVSGNVLSFSWEEPTASGPPLRGGGYLVFDQRGRTFAGKWWTVNRDRGGDWNGWRGDGRTPEAAPRPGPDDDSERLDGDDDDDVDDDRDSDGPAEQAPPQGNDDYI